MQPEPEAKTEVREFSHSALLDAGVLLLLGLVLGFNQIGARSLVYDETGTAAYGLLGPGAFVGAVRADPNMSLYYVLMFGWLRVFGDGVASLRAPSALFAALEIVAVYLLGRRLFGRGAGLTAAVLLAFDPFLLRYAQTARSYSLVLLLVTLSSYFLVREFEAPSPAHRAGYAVTSAAALYAQFFALYVLAAHALAVVATKRKTVLTLPWPTLAAAAAVLSLPAAVAIAFSGAGGRINWIPPPAWSAPAAVLFDLVGRGRTLSLACAGFSLLALVGAWRDRRLWPLILLLSWLLVPLTLSFLVSFAKPMFLSRYLIVCLPPLLLLAVAGIARLPPTAALAVGVLLGVLSARHALEYYRGDGPENWRDATHHILTTAQEGDVVVFVPNFAHRPFAYYARQFGLDELPDLTGRSLEGRTRVWMVSKGSTRAEKEADVLQRKALAESFVRAGDERPFAGVGVSLYTR